MKLKTPGIRVKLIVYFLLVILLPVAVSLVTLQIALKTVVPEQESLYSAELKQTVAARLDNLSGNLMLDDLYKLLRAGKSEELSRLIKKTWGLLSERGEALDIVRADGAILLSMSQKGVVMGGPEAPVKPMAPVKPLAPFASDGSIKEALVLRDGRGIVPGLVYVDATRAQYTWPIAAEPDGAVYARYLFPVPSELNAVENVSGQYTAIAVFSGVASFVVLVLFFSFRLSRGILLPLRHFSRAAEDIAAGNLDNPIRYDRTDEFGKVAGAFEEMRVRLRETLGRLHRADTERKQMVASASHDLRTPLTSIRGYVEGLRDGLAEKPETRERYFSVILDKTEQLERLIDGLFRMSRLELDDGALRFENLSSRALFTKIFERTRLDLESAGFEFQADAELPDLPLRADANALEQVVDNIVGNAKRYLAPGGCIRARLLPGGQELTVRISDNGPGFAPRDLPRVFDPFYRGDPARSSRHGEAGLGLAICKRLIEAHGGRILAENDEGGGAVVRFSLPLRTS